MPKLSSTYKINGTAIPEPSAAPVTINTLHGEATGRTDDGTMHTELISAGKRTVELKYDALTREQVSAMFKLLMAQYYTLTYLDPVDGTKTIECYGTPLAAEPDVGVYYNNMWRGVTFTCIER